MDLDPTLEFEHFLAQKLGMTRDELRERMSQAEFTDWQVYYGRKAQREELAMAKVKRR